MKAPHLLAAAVIGACSVPALAANFDFYKLGRGAGDFVPTAGASSCTGGDLCSTIGGTMTFASGGLTANATGTYNLGNATVVQDHESSWSASSGAGLGVYHNRSDTSDDNITFGESLTITFSQVVNLTSIGLRSDGHNYTGWSTGATFLLNGVSTLLPQNVGSISTDMTGQVFSFAFGGAHPDQFYLASLTAVPAVPEPGTYALLAAGLGVVSLVARRRRPVA